MTSFLSQTENSVVFRQSSDEQPIWSNAHLRWASWKILGLDEVSDVIAQLRSQHPGLRHSGAAG